MKELDRKSFAERHAAQIAPIVEQTITEVKNNINNPSALQEYLDKFATRLLIYEKSQATPPAKRVILEIGETLSLQVMGPIIKGLQKEPRCKTIYLLADGVAKQTFISSIEGQEFHEQHSDTDLLLTSLPEAVDVALTTGEDANSANSLILFGGKSVLNAQKIFYLISNWGGVGGVSFFEPTMRTTMDSIDAFLCLDKLAGKILLSQLSIDSKLIKIVGSPLLDSLPKITPEIRRSVREKLQLAENDFAVLYLGERSAGFAQTYSAHHQINEITLKQTLAVLPGFLENSKQRLAFLFRPHPADSQQKETLTFLAKFAAKHSNLICQNVPDPIISMDEVACAANVILSIAGTQAFLQLHRGIPAVLLGYDNQEHNLGKAMLEKLYPQKVLDEIKNSLGLQIATSPKELLNILIQQSRQATQIAVPPLELSNSVRRIIDLILA